MSETFDHRDDLEDIRPLVSAETEEALRRFRAGSFEANLRARIAGMDRPSGEAPKRPFLLSKPLVPAAVTALVLLLAGGAFLIVRHGRQGAAGGNGMFVKAVGMLPGLEGLTAGPGAMAPERGFAPDAGNPVASVLGQAYEEKRAEEDRTVPAADSAAPHFSLKKKVEILFKDRVLERVLSSIHERSKEV